MVAFEMVRQLERQGRDVDSLIFADVDPLALQMKDHSPNVFVLRYMGQLLRLDDSVIADAAEQLESAGREQLAAVLHDLVSRRDTDGSLGYEQIYQQVCVIQSRYSNAYIPIAYRPVARVLKIWAEDGAIRGTGEMPHSNLDTTWRQILQKETDYLVVPGDHETLIGRQYAPRLARLLNAWIEDKAIQSFDRLDQVMSPP